MTRLVSLPPVTTALTFALRPERISTLGTSVKIAPVLTSILSMT